MEWRGCCPTKSSGSGDGSGKSNDIQPGVDQVSKLPIRGAAEAGHSYWVPTMIRAGPFPCALSCARAIAASLCSRPRQNHPRQRRLWQEKRGKSGHQGFFALGAAARPYPKSRRKASLRDLISLCVAHLSTALMTGFGRRTATAGSWPVAGRPRPFLFLFTDIDLAIFCVYKKLVAAAEGAANTLRG
jgi:hypothetical protein